MSTSESDRPVVRRNDNLKEVIASILHQNIPGVDQLRITQVLLDQVKDVILQNMDKITAALSGALIVIGSSVLLPAIFVGVINLIGFTSGGVAAGSLAALIQGSVYGAWTGGVFSGLQSIGATAVIAPPVAIGLAATAVVVGGGVFAYKHYQKKKRIALGSSSDECTSDTAESRRRGEGDLPSIAWK